ncbi:hypothetical protein P7D52_07950 [Enterococcus dongliensis]|uniref:DUF1642 domain-containing protein n=1 Tax=Enterococcus dongliensis TaxID=2559925 RepID=A0AAW8TLW7_9ENTE|nr:hypothetical protein [Enterococcus dongliensis]MDT2635497.1 hypothetical protein [Enterococcus dongliensis]MDT2637664.1 hypothetical protein [Enterococcus dongliensis]MDT2642717.1 hypothetical protein [Enterococcus dongliensis]
MDLKKDQIDKKWMCSLKEDIWKACDYFDTKEEAIKAGLESAHRFNCNPDTEYLDDEMGSTPDEVVTEFLVGQINASAVPFCVDTLIENVQESAYDEGGEWADTYLDDVTKEDREELENLVFDWFIRNDYLPRWYTISSVEIIQSLNEF